MEKGRTREVVMVDIDALVPQEHLLRKVEKVMDYDWLYEHLSLYYCHDNGRNGTDPVVLVKMAYRWFLGYSLLDNIPHLATVSYAFCKR